MSHENEKSVADAVNAQKLDAILGDMGELKAAVRDLTKSVNRLAVIEERQANTADSLGRAFKEIEKHEFRISTLEKDQPIQKQSSDIVQKVIATILTVALTAGVTYVVAVKRGPVVIPSGK